MRRANRPSSARGAGAVCAALWCQQVSLGEQVSLGPVTEEPSISWSNSSSKGRLRVLRPELGNPYFSRRSPIWIGRGHR